MSSTIDTDNNDNDNGSGDGNDHEQIPNRDGCRLANGSTHDFGTRQFGRGHMPDPFDSEGLIRVMTRMIHSSYMMMIHTQV